MSEYHTDPPELVPVLSRGKHRSPRQGACFMEMASYLAGERWSDHPACTHPLLAALARDVNDCTSDASRARLVPLIASVIGLDGEDLHIDARIALVCARMALPVVAAAQQQVMAVSVLACEHVLAGLDGRSPGWLDDQSGAVLAQVPQAARWARSFTRAIAISPKAFRRHSAPATVHAAVEAIAQACVPHPDQMLHDLLAAAIAECAAWSGHDADRSTRRNSGRRPLTRRPSSPAGHQRPSASDPLIHAQPPFCMISRCSAHSTDRMQIGRSVHPAATRAGPPTVDPKRERGHGRTERRTLKVTSVAKGLPFPHAAQAIKVGRRRKVNGKWSRETWYAVTSLTVTQASHAPLAAIIRGHWGIEDRLHWVRDMDSGEDRSQARTAAGPRVMASLRNLVITIVRLAGAASIAAALRDHARRPGRPLQTIMKC